MPEEQAVHVRELRRVLVLVDLLDERPELLNLARAMHWQGESEILRQEQILDT